jgi:GDP-4-dehydro-6-deoxy-D-mannose reductase
VKILITGASGFVGRHLIEHFVEHEPDAEILGISRTPAHSAWDEPAPVLRKNIQYVQLNMLNAIELGYVLRLFSPDWVVHLAAHSSVGRSWQDPIGSFANNTSIFLNLVEKIRELGLHSRILSVGSSEQYGNSTRPLSEDDDLRPNSPYAVARVAQEMLSKIYAQSYGLHVVMTRSFNHVGPRQRDAFAIPSLAKQLVTAKRLGHQSVRVGNLSVIRDFVDVRDVARAYHALLLRGRSGEVYNVCTGLGYSLKVVVETMQAILGTNVELEVDPDRIRPTDCGAVVGFNGKITSETGWSPKIKLRESLEDVIGYWQCQSASDAARSA